MADLDLYTQKTARPILKSLGEMTVALGALSGDGCR